LPLQYLVLSLGDAKEATPTINKTLNPEWNTVLDLPIVGEQSLLLEVCCWDKDRFGKDYMGEFDVILEDQFLNTQPQQEPRWFPLQSRRTGKKKSVVSGEIQIQFSLVDTSNASAPPDQLMQKFLAIAGNSPSPDEEEAEMLLRADSNNTDVEDDEESSDEAQDESKKAEKREKRRKRLRLARLKKKAKQMSGYEYSSNGDVAGVLFLEIQKITDLPPERNGEYCRIIVLYTSSQRSSYTNLVRHGSLCRNLVRQEDVPHKDRQPQPQPRFRREARFPSPPPRSQLLRQLHSHR
jgi:phosphatidylserine decarboxylase